MSLITRCPACGTMFKVVPDHLRISDGWVRCGQCSEVFDARACLQELTPKAVVVGEGTGIGAAVAGDGAPVPEDSSTEGGDQTSLEEVPSSAQSPASGPPGANGEVAAAESVWPAPETTESPDGHEGQEAADRATWAPEPDHPKDTGAGGAGGIASAAMSANEGAATWSEPDSVLDDDMSFVREARRRAFWHGPWVRGGLLVLALVLMCLLGGQVLVHERDTLAATNPGLKPWLIRLCAPLNCVVSVPRRIEAVLIDSSTFSKVAFDTYRLTFTIRNSASLDVATPAVEVTLTDFQDQAVLRRVLFPSDLGAQPAIAPAGEWSAVVHMNVATSTAGGRVAGYRLFAFYP